MKIQIEESALDSLKAMVQQLHRERDFLLEKMREISGIECDEHGGYWDAIDQAQKIADAAIAACTETKQVLSGE